MSLLNRAIPALRRNLPNATPFTRQPSILASVDPRALRAYGSKPPQASSGKDKEPPQLPKFSLDGLGATPAIKAVVYTMIGVLATVETYTYSLWIYHKLYRDPSGQSRQDEGEAKG